MAKTKIVLVELTIEVPKRLVVDDIPLHDPEYLAIFVGGLVGDSPHLEKVVVHATKGKNLK